MFTGPLAVQFAARGCVMLTAPLSWRTTTEALTVPVGFLSDGATIPPLAWPFVGHPFSGSILRAAILHDYDLSRPIPRVAAHRRFRRVLRAEGVGPVRAWLLYAAVRVFGPR